MLDDLVTHSESFLIISAAIGIMFGLVTKYIIKPHHDKKTAVDKALRDDIAQYRANTAALLERVEVKLDSIERDQRANHVCAKQHTKELQEIKHDLGRGTQVMDDIKQRGIDTSTRLAKLEGSLGEHLRKT